MTFDDYQREAYKTAIYPREYAIEYPVLEIANEAGELAGKLKKYLRGDMDKETLREALIHEAGDVLWPLAALATELGINLSDIAQTNLDKLADRASRGVLQGDGDKR